MIVTDVWHQVMPCDVLLTPNSKFKIENKNERKMKQKSRIKTKSTIFDSNSAFCSSNSLNHFCYDLKLNSGYNLGKDLNKSEGDNQLVKYKDTGLYILINHEETRRYSEKTMRS